MTKNANVPMHVEYSVPNVQQNNFGLSVFNLQQEPEIYLAQDRQNRKLTFSAFINSRNQYLNRLTTLGDNWISGSSKQPTAKSIGLSKDLLNNLGYWYSDLGHKDFIYPKVIMSPTPAGGIA